MTRIPRASVFLVFVAMAPGLAHAGLRVWRDKNQSGPSQQVDHAVPDLRKLSLDDQISSLTADEPWLVCSEPRYKGECRLIDGTVDNLHGSGMNDRISSALPAPQGRAQGWEKRYGRLGVPSNAPDSSTPHAAIRVFEHEDYRGTSQVFDRPIANLANFGLANQITSVQIAGGEWQACTAPSYSGQCVVLRGNDDDLGSWSDRIVSLRPVGSQTTWGGVPVSSVGSRILVFADRDFEGTSRVFDHAVPDLARFGLARQVTSLRVEGGGSWEVCTEPGYQGECKVFRDSDQFLGRWSDTIASLRPVPDQER